MNILNPSIRALAPLRPLPTVSSGTEDEAQGESEGRVFLIGLAASIAGSVIVHAFIIPRLDASRSKNLR